MGGMRDWHCFKSIETPISQSSKRRRSQTRFADVIKPSGKGIIVNVARSFNNWRKFRQTVTELGRMSSRELQDLGIDRADIRSVARASIAR
jgi:uncharacterized protein YjiS (DUF1127 family)